MAAYLRFKETPNTLVRFVPHRTIKPLTIEEKRELFDEKTEVYLLDFVGAKNFIPELSKIVKSIVLIDHHQTALNYIEEWKEFPLENGFYLCFLFLLN